MHQHKPSTKALHFLHCITKSYRFCRWFKSDISCKDKIKRDKKKRLIDLKISNILSFLFLAITAWSSKNFSIVLGYVCYSETKAALFWGKIKFEWWALCLSSSWFFGTLCHTARKSAKWRNENIKAVPWQVRTQMHRRAIKGERDGPRDGWRTTARDRRSAQGRY